MRHDLYERRLGPASSDRSSGKEIVGLALLLALVGLVRLPFWPKFPLFGDGANYAFGALVSNVAHPPGSVGYCVLGGLLNDIVGNIQVTFLGLSWACSLAATAVCYFLAKEFGLSARAALLCAALYGTSLNTLASGLLVGPYIIEGTLAAAFVLFAMKASKEKSPGVAIAATAVFAFAGAFRPTTTYFLAPLWIYWLTWLYRPKRTLLLVNAVIAVAIIVAWYRADDYFMTKAGYGNRTYELQALMPSTYDYVSLSSAPKIGVAHLTYHMPMVEAIAWIEARAGVHLLPQVEGAPVPSLRRASTLAIIQLLKQSWWLVLSAPFVMLLPVAWIFGQNPWFSFPDRSKARVLAAWIAPASLFFVIGHMGQLAYLQIYLAAVCIFAVACFRQNGSTSVNSPLLYCGACVVAVNLLFFVAARPFGAPSGWKRSADLAALGFGGRSLRDGGISARIAGSTGQTLVGIRSGVTHASTDAEFLRAVQSEDFSPAPAFRIPAEQPAAAR